MHMPNMPIAHYGQRATGMLGDLVTYASWATVAACAAEGYYIFQHRQDLLAGFGLVHTHHDAIDLLKFYGITGAIAWSLATHKWLKVTAAGLAVVTLAGMYGTQFHLKAERAFDTNSLPKVTSPSLRDVSSTRDTPDTAVKPAKADPKAGEYFTTSTPDELAAWAAEKGYTKDRKQTKEGQDWCKEINPATGKANANDSEHALINCSTGYVWEPKQ